MTFNIPLLEKEMATHSSILAWEIPWKEEPGRLQSMGLERAGHDLATKQENIPLYRLIPSLILWLYLMNKYEINAFIQFSRPVVSDSLWPHGSQDARLPVHHQLPEFTQTHVHWVGDTTYKIMRGMRANKNRHFLLIPSHFLHDSLFSPLIFYNISCA